VGTYPLWELVYYYFRKRQADGTLSRVLAMLVVEERQRNGQQKQASAAAVDGRSAKKGSLNSLDSGVDRAKLVNERERHLAVDTFGLLLVVHVSSAHVQDEQVGLELLW
jgi:putative transposase